MENLLQRAHLVVCTWFGAPDLKLSRVVWAMVICSLLGGVGGSMSLLGIA